MKNFKQTPSSTKSYEWILFDADETLFHFDSFKGLQQMFPHYGVEFTEQDYLEYQSVNKPLWVEYQNGKITASELQYKRFTAWGDKLNVSPHELNCGFIDAMAEVCMPLDGATSLLNSMRGKAKLGIITNGFIQLQQARLERTGLQDHFDLVVISEEVGIAKPAPKIFDYALSQMGQPLRTNVLMVGDNPDSDILGGLNAGFDTCWLNRGNKLTPEDIKPHYEVSSLDQLEKLLLNQA